MANWFGRTGETVLLAGAAAIGAIGVGAPRWEPGPPPPPPPVIEKMQAEPASEPLPEASPDLESEVAPEVVTEPEPVPEPVSESGPALSVPPQIELLRVDDNGQVVFSGRAAPGAHIELREEGRVVATATADASGAFAQVFSRAGIAASGQLALMARDPGAEGFTEAGAPIIILPQAESGPEPILPVSTPEPNTAKSEVPNSALAEATRPAEPLADSDPATVISDLGIPMPDFTPPNFDLGTARLYIVRKGDYLWKLAIESYDDGYQYVAIYNENGDLISDPDLIYPGQEFYIPDLPEPASTSE